MELHSLHPQGPQHPSSSSTIQHVITSRKPGMQKASLRRRVYMLILFRPTIHHNSSHLTAP
ncbi:hypothetical protein GJAV_G00192830 [Gymnothorax javanicus]|nr:hypothetical protein GJAV_G00192830 [Gymnothorax javanicus]